MPTVERSVHINAPIQEVFAAATDPNRGPEWNPNVQPGSRVALPLHQGTQWDQTTIAMGRPMRLTCTVTGFEPPYFGELAITGEQKARSVTRCEEEDGGTRLTQSFEFIVPGGALGRMVGGLAERMLGHELERTMGRIKMTLEIEHGVTDGLGSPG